MKKLTILAILFCVSALTFTSCVPADDTPTPNNPNNPNDNTINTFASLTLGNQNNAGAGCFIDLDKGVIYTLAQAYADQEAIDMVFYHDAPSQDPWLSCPSQLSYFSTYDLNIETDAQYGVNKWTTKNPCEIGFTDISIATFDAVNSAVTLTTAYDGDSHVMIGAEPNVKGGMVYKFRTNTGRIGLIKIKSVDGNANTTGKMIIDLKVLK